jgi:hypothetical protein
MRNISAILGNVKKEGKAPPEPELEGIPGGSISTRGMGRRERGKALQGNLQSIPDRSLHLVVEQLTWLLSKRRGQIYLDHPGQIL